MVQSEAGDMMGQIVTNFSRKARARLRREFPDVAFHDFESWAKTQEWNMLLQGA